jgi:transposase
MGQVQIITGVERRRRWSEAEKRAVVAAAFAPGAIVMAVARQADVSTALIYRWRREIEDVNRGFAEVVVSPVVAEPAQRGEPVIEVVIGGTAEVRISASAPPDLAAAIVKALTAR